MPTSTEVAIAVVVIQASCDHRIEKCIILSKCGKTYNLNSIKMERYFQKSISLYNFLSSEKYQL